MIDFAIEARHSRIMETGTAQPPFRGSEPPPIPAQAGIRGLRIVWIVFLSVALAIGVVVGGFFLFSGIAARRPGAAVVLHFYREPQAAETDAALWRSVRSSIEKRVNQLGGGHVSDAGQWRLRVKFPGRKAGELVPAAVALTRTARLDFRLVHRGYANMSQPPPMAEVPLGYQIMSIARIDAQGRRTESYSAVKRIPEQTGADIAEATPLMDADRQYGIMIRFTDAGTRRFAEVTGAHVGEQLAIVLDGQLYSAPRITDRVAGGRAHITGTFTQREALELANILTSPLPLPAAASIENEYGIQVDPPQ